jgi:hypothetical protein
MTDISLREYDCLKSQMNDMLNKITIFEEDQKEIEILKMDQNELKENYLKLEEKYLKLEEVNNKLSFANLFNFYIL